MLLRLLPLLLLGTAASAQVLPPDWTVPDQLIAETDVPEEVVVRGVPTQMRASRSRWKADDLFRHYYRLMDQAHFYIPPEKDQVKIAKSLQLTGVEVGSNITVTIILTPAADGTTNVIIGQADFSGTRKPGAAGSDLPLMPNAQRPLRTHTEGLRMVVFETASPPEKVHAHYDAETSKRGYRKIREGLYDNGQAQVRVSVTVDKSGVQHVNVAELGVPSVEAVGKGPIVGP